IRSGSTRRYGKSMMETLTLPQRNTQALILGAGYLGARVGSLLLASGMKVTATTTRPERLNELNAQGLEPALFDFARPEKSSIWSKSYSAVVCGAARGRNGDPRSIFHDGPLECARRLFQSRPPPRFVFLSSTGVYSQKDGSDVDEKSSAEPLEERP